MYHVAGYAGEAVFEAIPVDPERYPGAVSLLKPHDYDLGKIAQLSSPLTPVEFQSRPKSRKARARVSSRARARARAQGLLGQPQPKTKFHPQYNQFDCTTLTVIRLAVAVDSSFVASAGGLGQARLLVHHIVTQVDGMFRKDVCAAVQLTDLEIHSDLATDPYMQGDMATGHICSPTGLERQVCDWIRVVRGLHPNCQTVGGWR